MYMNGRGTYLGEQKSIAPQKEKEQNPIGAYRSMCVCVCVGVRVCVCRCVCYAQMVNYIGILRINPPLEVIPNNFIHFLGSFLLSIIRNANLQHF